MVGIAGVVSVLVALLAMAQGFQETLKSAGNEDTAIVLRAGANAELSSGLDRASVILIAQAPGVRQTHMVYRSPRPRWWSSATCRSVATGTDANVEVRGVGAQVWTVRPEVSIVSGRRFEPGLRELIVGRGALAQFRGFESGSTVLLNGQAWKVVGVFASGDSDESEIWGDAESVADSLPAPWFPVRERAPARCVRLRRFQGRAQR